MSVLLVASLVLAVPAPSATEVRESLDRVYGAGGYQKELPGVAGAEKSATAQHRPERDVSEWLFPLGALAPYARALLIAALAVTVAIAILWLWRRWAVRAAPRDLVADGVGGAEPLGDGPLVDADAFAREGRFAEAIHVLLLRTFEHLVRRTGASLSPAWTSREVLDRARIGADARGALAELVAAVERCWFAGAPPSRADWERCQHRFRIFSDALSSGAAA